jgi:hypothetical protein
MRFTAGIAAAEVWLISLMASSGLRIVPTGAQAPR